MCGHNIYLLCILTWQRRSESDIFEFRKANQFLNCKMTGIIYIFWLLLWCWLVAIPAALCHAIVSSGMSLERSSTRDGSKSGRSSSSAELSKVSHRHFRQMLSTSPRRAAVSYWLLNQQQITALFPCWLSSIGIIVAIRLEEILNLFLMPLCSPAVLIHENFRPS